MIVLRFKDYLTVFLLILGLLLLPHHVITRITNLNTDYIIDIKLSHDFVVIKSLDRVYEGDDM